VKIRLFPLLFLPLSAAHADTFGSGGNQFTIDFVEIGDAGNADDNTGYGGVDYAYRISTYEISESMIGSYNALNGGPVITLDNRGPNRPATSVSWNEAARFVNWLNTSSGYSVAYKFETGGANDNISLWTGADAGYDPANPFRNSNAYYFLPSEDEWYKAAYYDPNANGGTGGYWDYATGSDTAPTAVAGGSSGAVYNGQSGPADITNAGGLSPYGTMAQNGNAWEWGESGFTAPNDSAGESRVFRGGVWNFASLSLQSSSRTNIGPTNENGSIGFRVAAVPEPSAALMTLLGAMGLLMKRRRA
jgi:formylglycine-generating enzyme required for sulfatase activity